MKGFLKRIIATAIVISFVIGMVGMFENSVEASAEKNDDTVYTVLMLDLGGGLYINSQPETGTLELYNCRYMETEVKAAAKKYVEHVIAEGRNEQIAIVAYAASATLISDFTDDLYEVIECIDNANAPGANSNINYAFNVSEDIFNNRNITSGKRNIVNFTKGFCSVGDYTSVGKYSIEDCYWYNYLNSIRFYECANSVLEKFEMIEDKYNIYTVYIMQDYDETYQKEVDLINFSKRFSKDIQNSGYIEVEDVDNLIFDFSGWNAPIISTTFRFASVYAHKDVEAACYYSDSYFEKPSTEYNEHLETMSLCLELSTWSSYSEHTIYTDEEEHVFPKFINARSLLTRIGFTGFSVNDMWENEPTPDSVGVVAANKELPDGSTLVALAIRGGNYGQEWAGNFTIGLTGEHKSWSESKDAVITFFNDYLETQNITGDVKLWIVGYSKGGAIANLVAAELGYGNSYGKVYSWSSEDVYAYTFEAPQGAMKGLVSWRKYNYIHNILNENDLVPLVAPKEWGFARYGEKKNLPNPKYVGDNFLETEIAMEKYLNQFIRCEKEMPFNIQTTVTYKRIKFFEYPILSIGIPLAKYETQEVLTKDLINNSITFIADDLIGSRENYYYNYQAVLRDFMCLMFGGDLEDIFDEEFTCADFCEVLREELTLEKYREIISPIMGNGNIAIRQQKVIENFKKFLQETLEEYDLGFTALTISHLGESLGQLFWNLGQAALKETTFSGIGDIYNMYELVQLLLQGSLMQPHYPEVTLSWMMYEDDYYGKNDHIKVGRKYRVAHINCPVDVNVYSEDSGKLVASIINDTPQEIDDSYIVTYINKEGEKIVILPADTNYKIEIVATDTGEFNYTIDEYNYDVEGNTRVINYYNIPIEEGDVYLAKLPAMNEEELYEITEESSTVQYNLFDDNDVEVLPDSDLKGVDAMNAIYQVEVKQSEFGYVLGGGEYSVGSFAEISASPMYGGKFLGWYCNDELVSTDEIYRFPVKEDIELQAKFSEVELSDISFESDEGGVVFNEELKVPAGVTVFLEAVAIDGYEFEYWSSTNDDGFEDIYAMETKFIVPSEDVVIKAHFRNIDDVSEDSSDDINEEIQEDLKEDLNEEEKVVDVMTGNGISYVFIYLICAMAVIILMKGKLNVYAK